jgi:hypothetical protein
MSGHREKFMKDIARGLLAGFIATAPMTVSMAAMFYLLPRRQQYRLPPRQVTMNVLRRLPDRGDFDERDRSNLTLLSHFAYGAASGAVYAPIARKLRPPGPLGGTVHGLATWAASYLGWLPALGVLTPATQHPAERNALMIAAHVIWGVVAGALVEQMMREEDRAQVKAPVGTASSDWTETASDGRPRVEIH